MTLPGRMPWSSAALTKSRSEMSRVAERSTRATCGACETPTASVISHSLGPEQAQQQQREHELRKRQDHVDRPHDDPVADAAQVGGRDAGQRSARDPERGRAGGHDQQHPAAVEHPRQHVAPQVVAAEQELAGGLAERQGDQRVRGVRGHERADDRDQHDAQAASPSPIVPRGVRTAAQSTDARSCRRTAGPRRGWDGGAAGGTAGAFAVMGATWRSFAAAWPAARSTSVRMFMTT